MPHGIVFIMNPRNATYFQKIKNLMFIHTKFLTLKFIKNTLVYTLRYAMIFGMPQDIVFPMQHRYNVFLKKKL